MVLDQEADDRDSAVRAMLVAQVRRPAAGAASLGLEPSSARRSRFGVPALVVTCVVLLLVIVLSAVAVQLGGGRAAPANGGEPSRGVVFDTERPPSTDAAGIPQVEAPAGKLLGRWTSAGGPNQKHVIDPKGLALSYRYSCTGQGKYLFSISHDSEESGSGGCGSGGGGYGDKGHTGALTVTIRTAKAMRWSFVVVGIPETYVTPQPVLRPTDSSGAAVPFCTADRLSARFERVVGRPGNVSVAGQIALTNTTGTPCALAGTPLVRFLDGRTPLGRHTMAAIDDRSSERDGLRAVVLGPGGRAWTQVGWYLPAFYEEGDEPPCRPLSVHALRVDLANRMAGPAQQGSLDVPIGSATACLDGKYGTDGKYGQLSATVFVDYALAARK